jgi:hypothetical protein
MATKTLKINGVFTQFVEPLAARAPFKTGGALSGGAPAGYVGRLPGEYRSAATAATVDYVVLSYGTPIAWHDTVTGWTVPEVKYSVTTSKHQGRIGAAISTL